MLLEELVNRYRNPWVAPIRFPSVILPVLMIIGAFLAFVFMPFVILMFVLEVLPEVFTPKLTLVSALVGSGLVLAPLSVAAIYGQVLEKRTGYVRSGYEAKIMLYLFILGMSLPFPAYYGFKFFYNYPFARYPSYILEVKPSPELKEEIERFGLAEIKWHTPYDYSLDRQVIRYDFGEPIDGDWRTLRSKRKIFEEVAGQDNREYINTIKAGRFLEQINDNGILYPEVKSAGDETLCVMFIPTVGAYANWFVEYEGEGERRKLKVVSKNGQNLLLDMSGVFQKLTPETAFGYDRDKRICSLRSYSSDYLFVAAKLLLPRLNDSVSAYSKEYSMYFNPTLEQFVESIRSL